MKTACRFLFALLLILSALTSRAEYARGFTWDFSKMFSQELATGRQDASGNATWEYKWYDAASPKPSEAVLMQSFHHWEKVAGWQPDARTEHMDKICVDRIQAYSGKGGIQINWVAPISGKVALVIRVENFQGAQLALNLFSIYKNDEPLVPERDGRYYYLEELETVQVQRGDRLAFRMITNDGWGWFDDFQFTVSLLSEDR